MTKCRHAVFFELANDAVGVIAAGDDDEADAHVENAEHFRFVDSSQALQPTEHGRHRPTALADEDAALNLLRRQFRRWPSFVGAELSNS